MSSSEPRTVTFTPDSEPDERVDLTLAASPAHAAAAAPRGGAGGREDGDPGRYAVERELGRGGMGTVSLARDRIIGRRVAIKELNPDAKESPSRQARFAREAYLQGQLEHPAIVPVYDVGYGPDGSAFFTMKRVRGQSLATILGQMKAGEATRFTPRRLLSSLSQLCLAAHYAHERGVVHRDIKPANIMLGSYGEVYLLDWGIAKVDDEAIAPGGDAEGPDDASTGFGAVLGSLSTMAPEQAMGGRVDARADVYALGAVLFEIVTLTPLHPRGEIDDVLPAIIAGVDARPSVRAPDRDVAPELESACVAATRLDPADRLPSAFALHELVEAYLEGDRDLALRRESADKHARAARDAAERALEADGTAGEAEEARAQALHEVGRALALDPDAGGALATLVRLLTTPPRVVPTEVREEQEALLRFQIRRGGVAAAAVYGLVLIDNISGMAGAAPTGWTTETLLWAGAFVCALLTIRLRSYPALFATFLVGVTASAWVTNSVGPFIIVPNLVTLHAVLYSFVQSWRVRVGVVVGAALAWTVAVAGEGRGLFADTVRFAAGEISIKTRLVEDAGAMSVYLWLVTLLAIVAPSLVVGFIRSAWRTTDEAMRLQAWQLRRLVSEERGSSRGQVLEAPRTRSIIR
jgi:eukaryotic-like serine/threonine-protein kinase